MRILGPKQRFVYNFWFMLIATLSVGFAFVVNYIYSNSKLMIAISNHLGVIITNIFSIIICTIIFFLFFLIILVLIKKYFLVECRNGEQVLYFGDLQKITWDNIVLDSIFWKHGDGKLLNVFVSNNIKIRYQLSYLGTTFWTVIDIAITTNFSLIERINFIQDVKMNPTFDSHFSLNTFLGRLIVDSSVFEKFFTESIVTNLAFDSNVQETKFSLSKVIAQIIKNVVKPNLINNKNLSISVSLKVENQKVVVDC